MTFTPTSALPEVPDPYAVPLETLDVSDPRLFATSSWQPFFKRMRTEDPVHYLKESPFGPFWSITRFEDIKFVDMNHELFSSEPFIVIGDPGEDLPVDMFIAMDPPKHDVQRNAVQPVVAPKNLAEMESLIRERIALILDSLPTNEVIDWVPAVSVELTSMTLATIFDFPLEDRAKLPYWSDLAAGTEEISGGKADPQERLQAMQDMAATFGGLWQDKVARLEAGEELGFDLISLLVKDPQTRDMVTRPMEFMGNLMLLIVGGNDTTRNSISASVLGFHRFPAEFTKLKANPGLIPSMVSEVIRWQTPLSHMRRIATQDVELNGKTIRKGDKVVMWYASGNRDEEVIERPDEIIIDRPRVRQHLSFGFGIHRCMGNRLGEMQLRLVWEEILKRFERIEVVGEPERLRSNFVNGITSLPVRIIPKAAS